MPDSLLKDLYGSLSPSKFESFLSVLLEAIEFSDVRVVGRSGDRGVDLVAIWTQTNIPGLEINIPFKIQAKLLAPDRTLSPRFVRELRGTLRAGEWGLLITTAKVTPATFQEGIDDVSRVISIIDGHKLIELCKKYEIGVKPEYRITLPPINNEVTQPQEDIGEVSTINQQEILQQALGERFSKLGSSPIYKSSSKVLITRISQQYNRPDTNYWYGMTPKDFERVNEFKITHFAYICANLGVVLIPVKIMMTEVKLDNLDVTLQAGRIRHYHIRFREKNGSMFWTLRDTEKNIDSLFFRVGRT